MISIIIPLDSNTDKIINNIKNNLNIDHEFILLNNYNVNFSYFENIKEVKNKCIGKAFSKAVEISEGEYICYFPDNINIDFRAIKKIYNSFSYDADIVCSRVRIHKKNVFNNFLSSLYVTALHFLFWMPYFDIDKPFIAKKEVFNKVFIESRSKFFFTEFFFKALHENLNIREVNIFYNHFYKNKMIRSNEIIQILKDIILCRFFFF